MSPEPTKVGILKRAALLSVAVGLLMFFMKMGAYLLTGSAAILSDALESVVHVVATGFALYSVVVSSRPADRTHPYGHGRIEFFSAGFEGALIVIAALAIIWTAVPELFRPGELPNLDIGTGATALAGLINLALGAYLIRTGRREGSLTLVADGKHVLTDSYTSLGVVVGLGLVLVTDWNILDPIVALLVAGNILLTGYKLIRQSVSGLMDEADEAFIADVTHAFNTRRRPEWIDVHRLRCWRSGETRHLDFHLTLPYYVSVVQAHDIESGLTETMKDALESPVQVLIHHDPCMPSCCHFCAVQQCPVREHPLESQKELTPQGVIREADYLPAASESARQVSGA